MGYFELNILGLLNNKRNAITIEKDSMGRVS